MSALNYGAFWPNILPCQTAQANVSSDVAEILIYAYDIFEKADDAYALADGDNFALKGIDFDLVILENHLTDYQDEISYVRLGLSILNGMVATAGGIYATHLGALTTCYNELGSDYDDIAYALDD